MVDLGSQRAPARSDGISAMMARRSRADARTSLDRPRFAPVTMAHRRRLHALMVKDIAVDDMKPAARAWGLQTRYRAADGSWRTVSPRNREAVLEALGAAAPAPERRDDWPLVVVAGEAHPELATGGDVELESGGSRPMDPGSTGALPVGYHRLHQRDRVRPLIVVPRRCHIPPGLRDFGFAVQLYAARSRKSWGIGDMVDLKEMARWARGLGAGMLLVNPLHATLPSPPVEASPYFPTSRLFRNPLYLNVEAVRGGGDPRVEALARRGRALNAERRIDRDAVARLKIEALTLIFEAGGGAADVDVALERRPRLGDFALFCALAERHGPDWRRWPGGLRDREPGALASAGAELRERIRFHAWLQLLLDDQMHSASTELRLIQDLAVGVDPGGADAWMWQGVLAFGVTVGAPPDVFITQGQDWGLPPFDPWKLRAAGYAPFIDTIRANLGGGGGLRIDHVMGLRRLWWVPPGFSPADGAYVEYPVDDLLGIVALESVRQAALVVGEDLGTIEASLRRKLRRRGLLSYPLLLFEDSPPQRWPRQALAAVTTHDLPTTAGLWDGSDLDTQRRLDLRPNESGTAVLVERIRRGGPEPGASTEAAILHAHRQLAESPCMLLAATLEDVASVRERPNQPGTTGAVNPNWSRALPMPRERLQRLPMAGRLAQILRR